MENPPSRWSAAALGVALGLVLAAPVALLRPVLRPVPLDARHLRVRFESVRYERAGLVFTYLLENRTRRSASLLPNRAKLRAVQQEDGPVVGYPVMSLPLDIAAHASRRVEVRLELAMPRALSPRESADQTARVLQHQLPDVARVDSPLSPLPMTELPAAPEPPKAASPETLLANALTALEGFELVDESHDIHIVFPRGW
jgi:hypothetical protein